MDKSADEEEETRQGNLSSRRQERRVCRQTFKEIAEDKNRKKDKSADDGRVRRQKTRLKKTKESRPRKQTIRMKLKKTRKKEG